MKSSELDQAQAAEREAAKHLDLRNQKPSLILAVALYIGFLVAPYAGGASGFAVFSGRAGIEVNAIEYIFMVLLTASVAVLTPVVIVLRRTAPALVAWCLSTVAFVMSLLLIWIRGASPAPSGWGIALAIAAAGFAAIAYALIALRRSPAQLAAQQAAREAAGRLDPVGVLQQDIHQHAVSAAHSPLVDNRRAQAQQRHRRALGASDEQHSAAGEASPEERTS